MARLALFVKSRLNTWDEICLNEDARLRNNTIWFTLAVFCLAAAMLVVDIVEKNLFRAVFSAVYAVVTLVLFLVQFNSLRYRPGVAFTFGGMALALCAFMLYSGGVAGYGFLWIFLVPGIGCLVLKTRWGLWFNCALVAIVLVMLLTPLHNMLLYPYATALRALFPVALALVAGVACATERLRYKTHKQLITTTEALQAFAFTDPLTKTYNRHALVSHFGNLQNDAHGLCFAMLDLDFFKKVNDRYGHTIGDKMLCHVVKVILQTIPPNALLYRWGGEEFLLVLKTSNCDDAELVLQKIRNSIEIRPLDADGRNILMTVSIGGVYAQKGSTIKDCIHHADACLYEAKQSGRNQIVSQHY